jgi:acyl carrier protein
VSPVKHQKISRKIKEMIADICAVSSGEVRDEGKLLGYGLDSVRVIELLLAIEEELGVEINESDPGLLNVQTVADLVGFVEARSGQ